MPIIHCDSSFPPLPVSRRDTSIKHKRANTLHPKYYGVHLFPYKGLFPEFTPITPKFIKESKFIPNPQVLLLWMRCVVYFVLDFHLYCLATITTPSRRVVTLLNLYDFRIYRRTFYCPIRDNNTHTFFAWWQE